MSPYRMLLTSLTIIMLVAVSGCANTIRGAGQDVSNTVDATGDAAENIGDEL